MNIKSILKQLLFCTIVLGAHALSQATDWSSTGNITGIEIYPGNAALQKHDVVVVGISTSSERYGFVLDTQTKRDMLATLTQARVNNTPVRIWKSTSHDDLLKYYYENEYGWNWAEVLFMNAIWIQ